MTYRYLPNFALRAIQIALLIEAIVRGLMYLLSPEQPAIKLTDLENSAPLYVWGWLFVSCAVVGLFGEALMSGTTADYSSTYDPRAWPSFLAHSGLMVLYGALTVASAVTLVKMGLFNWGVIPYDLGMLGFLHWMYARRRRGHRVH